MLSRLFRSRSSEKVKYPEQPENSICIIDVRDAKVVIWSSAPDTYLPYTIEFVHENIRYRLRNPSALPRVCRAYRDEPNILFSARLVISISANNVEGGERVIRGRIMGVLPEAQEEQS